MKKERQFLKSQRGFTLLELLVILSITCMIISFFVALMGGSRGKARDSRRMGDLRQIPIAQELVMNDNGSYQKNGSLKGDIPAIKNLINYQYLAPIKDPLSNVLYQYVWIANDVDCGSLTAGTFYCALAKMETKNGCALNEYRYFVVSNLGQKERCDTNDYILNAAPNCSTCLAF